MEYFGVIDSVMDNEPKIKLVSTIALWFINNNKIADKQENSDKSRSSDISQLDN